MKLPEHIKNYLNARGMTIMDVILCEFCGKVAQDIHHIKLRSQGGGHEYENLIALCGNCHDKAHGKRYPVITRDQLQELARRRPEPQEKILYE